MTGKVDEADGKLAFGIVAPIYWTKYSAEVKKALHHTYKSLKQNALPHIFVGDPPKHVKAGADGIHLTLNCIARYIAHIHDLFLKIASKQALAQLFWGKLEPQSVKNRRYIPNWNRTVRRL